MRVLATYSHKNGEAFLQEHRRDELNDVLAAIMALDGPECLRKISREKSKPPLLFSPLELNHRMKTFLSPRGWTEPDADSKKGFREPRLYYNEREYREMDGIENTVGLEIQFGKYAFMGYDIFSKMPIFAQQGLIDCGIEVVAMPSLSREMSTGVSSFSQIVNDMKHRGEADLDVPTLVIGIGLTTAEQEACEAKRARFRTAATEMIEAGEVGTSRTGTTAGGPKPLPQDGDADAD
jgi:hypothetical protein